MGGGFHNNHNSVSVKSTSVYKKHPRNNKITSMAFISTTYNWNNKTRLLLEFRFFLYSNERFSAKMWWYLIILWLASVTCKYFVIKFAFICSKHLLSWRYKNDILFVVVLLFYQFKSTSKLIWFIHTNFLFCVITTFQLLYLTFFLGCLLYFLNAKNTYLVGKVWVKRCKSLGNLFLVE